MTNLNETNFHTRPTFLLGLGGTGVNVLRLLKARYQSQLGELPKTIRLLAIDTDDQKPGMPGETLDSSEYIHAANFSATDVIRDLGSQPKVKNWWHYGDSINPGFIDQGAGAKRPVGRLAFFHRFQSIYREMERIANEPIRYVNQLAYPERLKRSAVVYVIGSIAGGTGTGMFIDATLVFRSLVEKIWHSGSAVCNGLLVLPSVFSREVDPVVAQRHNENGFAALKELDFLQTRGRGRFPSDFSYVDYPQIGRLDVRSPFDWVYLVGNRNAHGTVFSRDEVFQRIAEFTFASIALPVGEEGRSRLDNENEARNPERRGHRGSHGIYSSFGVETLETPSSIEDLGVSILAGDLAALLSGSPTIEKNQKTASQLIAECAPLHELRQQLLSREDRRMLFPALYQELQRLSGLTKRDEARQQVETVRSVLEAELARYQPDLSAIKGELERWISATVANSFMSPNCSLGAIASTLGALRAELSKLTDIAVEGSAPYTEQLRVLDGAKGFLGFGEGEKVRQALEDFEAWFIRHYDGQVLQKLVRHASAPLAEAAALLEAWSNKLSEAQRWLAEAAKQVQSVHSARATQAVGQAPSPLMSVEKAVAAFESHRGELAAEALERVLLHRREDIQKLVAERARQDQWSELLEGELRVVVSSARRRYLKRSPEVAARIVKAVEICHPFVHFDSFEHRNRVELGMQKVPPIWFISSFNKGEDIELGKRLDDSGVTRLIEGSQPEITDSLNPDRDQVFIAQHGLFLDTMYEVQTARQQYEALTSSARKAKCLFPHVEAVLAHQFFASDSTKVERYFAAAFLTNAIRMVGSTFQFDETVLGERCVVEDGVDWAERLARARNEFERGSFVWTMTKWVNDQCAACNGNDVFKAVMREKIVEAKRRQWQPELKPHVDDMCVRFEELLATL